MRLISDSTCLRRFQESDLTAFQAYRNDSELAKFQNWERLDDAAARDFIAHEASVTPLIRPGKWTQIAIADADTDALLGDMGWRLSNDESEAELGITLARDAQGQGHATRATSLAIDYLFAETQIDCVKVWSDARNTASRALAGRLGFTFSGYETTDGIQEAAFVMDRP
jgi:RimJ/RimL family protein N-acetyltransferase